MGKMVGNSKKKNVERKFSLTLTSEGEKKILTLVCFTESAPTDPVVSKLIQFILLFSIHKDIRKEREAVMAEII
jgi:hypothetical protein